MLLQSKKLICKGSKYFIDFPNSLKNCIIIITGAPPLSRFLHVLTLAHFIPSELLHLNCIFCYKLIQICEMGVSEVAIWPGVHICLHFANTVQNPAIDATLLSTGTVLVWVETKVQL